MASKQSLFILLGSLAAPCSPASGMQPETVPLAPQAASSSNVIDRYVAATEAGDAAAASALFAPGARYADRTFDFEIEGAAAIRSMLTQAFAWLQPVRRRIVRVIRQGENAAIEWEMTGTQVLPMLGVPATGRELTVRGVSLIIGLDGRILSVTDYLDRVGLERQLRGTNR